MFMHFQTRRLLPLVILYGALNLGACKVSRIESVLRSGSNVCVAEMSYECNPGQHPEEPVSPELPAINDTVKPEAARGISSFGLADSDNSLLQLNWTVQAKDNDDVSRVILQVFSSSNPDDLCKDDPVATYSVPLNAKAFNFNRYDDVNFRGYLSVKLRTEDRAGNASESECSSDTVRNTSLFIAGDKDAMALGKARAYGDVNGDGITDVISYDFTFDGNRGYLAVILGGEKFWKDPPLIYYGHNPRAAAMQPETIQAVDMTGDGAEEIVFLNRNWNSWTGRGLIIQGFTEWPASGTDLWSFAYEWQGSAAESRVGQNPAFIDLNADGRMDLVCGLRELFVVMGADNFADFEVRRYSDPDFTSSGGPQHLTVDLTGDGIKELIIYNSYVAKGGTNRGKMWILDGTLPLPASGAFPSTGAGRMYWGSTNGQMVRPFFEDLNKDGHLDLFHVGGNINIILGGGPLPASGALSSVAGIRYTGANLKFDSNVSLYSIVSPFNVLHDANNDGFKDFVVADGTDTVIVLGSASLPATNALANIPHTRFTGTIPTYMYVDDVTGDGGSDLIAADSNADVDGKTDNGLITIIPMGPSLTTGTVAASAVGYRVAGHTSNYRLGDRIEIGDVTGDGIADIVSFSDFGGESNKGYLAIIFGGPSVATPALVLNGAADVGRRYNPTISANGFEPIRFEGPDVSDQNTYLHDISGDGVKDIIVQGKWGASIYLLPGGSLAANGVITSAAFSIYPHTGNTTVCDQSKGVKILDFNQDGINDIVCSNPYATDPISNASQAGAIYFIAGRGNWVVGDSGNPSNFVEFYGTAINEQLDMTLTDWNVDVDADGTKDLVTLHSMLEDKSVSFLKGGSEPKLVTYVTPDDGLYFSTISSGGWPVLPFDLVDISGDGVKEVIGSAVANVGTRSSNGLTNNGGIYIIPGKFIIFE